MADILKYRIPSHDKVELTGFFREMKSLQAASGFIISTFLKDKIFEFSPSTISKSEFSFSKSEPFVIEKSEYLKAASSFLNAFDDFHISKAVFSRVKEIPFDDLKIVDFFNCLCETYTSAFVYLISGEEIGTWIGASPETLLKVHENVGFTMSLAGTKSISKKNIVWGNKEKAEQQYVTDFILSQLEHLGVEDLEMNGPYDIQAGPVIHLRTDISFDLENVKIVDIAKKLHPTPAISGVPQKEAIELINFREAHDRDLYSGIIGLIEKDSASLYVNLRCCQIQRGKAFLYLGGGFTSESDVELEWEETENKSRTLLNIIETL
jgi:isochorismate synthase